MNSLYGYRDIAKPMVLLSIGASFLGYNALFGVSDPFLTLHEPCARLSRRHKNVTFLSFRVNFVGYSTLFWGPGTIFDAP